MRAQVSGLGLPTLPRMSSVPRFRHACLTAPRRRQWLSLLAALLIARPALADKTSKSSTAKKTASASTKSKSTKGKGTSTKQSKAREPLREPPNLAALDEQWVSSGQPSSAWLGLLKQKGFDAVLYLAPSSVGDAVADEPEIVRGQGLSFAHIPVDIARPTLEDYQAFETQVADWRARQLKLLVHCQLNMRASTFSFLYRVRNEGADPATAWAAVQQVWTPLGPWKVLVQQLLAERSIDFDPF